MVEKSPVKLKKKRIMQRTKCLSEYIRYRLLRITFSSKIYAIHFHPIFFSPDEEIRLTLCNIRLGTEQGKEVNNNDRAIGLHLPTTVTDTGGLMVGVPMFITLPRKIGEQGYGIVHQLVAEYLPEVSKYESTAFIEKTQLSPYHVGLIIKIFCRNPSMTDTTVINIMSIHKLLLPALYR